MLLLIYITIFILITVIYISTDIYKNERFNKYLSVISIFASLSIVISFILNIQNQNKEKLKRLEQEFLKETETYWNELEKMFINNYPYLNNLYKELYSDNPNIQLVNLAGDDLVKSINQQQHACQILFQNIENIYNTRSILENKSFGWYPIFKKWSKSKIFRENWNYSKNFYNIDTQKFIGDLISN